MEQILDRIGRRLSPEFDSMTAQERAYWLSDAVGLFYAAPLALIGLIWLAARTRLDTVREHWPVLCLAVGLILLFRRLAFFLFAEIKTGLYADWGGTFDSVIIWSAALVLGPVAFWPGVLLSLARFIYKWREYASSGLLLSRLRYQTLEIANDSLLAVLALSIYEYLGGTYPLPGVQVKTILLALFITFVWYLLSSLLWAPYFFMTFLPPSGVLPSVERRAAIRTVIRLYTVAEILPALHIPFAVLSAGLYGEFSFWMYALMLSGLVLPAFLASRLSQAAERGYHRTRELERLDRLSTAIIDAPSDASTLPELLQEHVPGMFPDSQIEVRIFPSTTLLRSSQDYPPVPEAVWDWLKGWSAPEPRFFLDNEERPWSKTSDGRAYLIAPIYHLSSGDLIGGVCVMVRWWPNKIIPYFLPAVQSLAALISSTLHQAETTAQMLAHERVAQELALAGEIQASLLPQELPQPPGWQLAAALEPTRETSGDFYDVIPLLSGRLGITIADVADKGMGAALYMTLSRTLIRSYALEHEHRPDLVLRAVNQRLLADTRAEMFVTVFYAVLDPNTGRLDYCNAGHNPPLLFSPDQPAAQPILEGAPYTSRQLDAPAGLNRPPMPHHQATALPEVIALKNTGMALGVLEDIKLQRASIQMEPGSVLVLYTDGITDARNSAGEYFDLERLIETVRSCPGCSADELRAEILNAVHNFIGEAIQEDDVTLMVIARERKPVPRYNKAFDQ